MNTLDFTDDMLADERGGMVRDQLSAIGQQMYVLSHPDGGAEGGEMRSLSNELVERGFERVGSGGGRRVFRLPEAVTEVLDLDDSLHTADEGYVVKFALYAATDDVDGRAQNRQEMELSDRLDTPYPFGEYILRTVADGEAGFWVIQPYADVLVEECHELFDAAGDFAGMGYGSDFTREDNWGFVDGRLRLIDFGYLVREDDGR